MLETDVFIEYTNGKKKPKPLWFIFCTRILTKKQTQLISKKGRRKKNKGLTCY